MAGDWIKMRTDLADDPAVIAIACRVEMDEFAVVGRLHRIWAWADAQTTNGNAPGVTSAWIDRFVSCAGFAEAMSSVGWLEIDQSGVSFPRFEKHNLQTGKARALTAKRVASHKRKGNAVGNADGNARTVSTALPTEEKRREDIKKDLIPLNPPFENQQQPATFANCQPEMIPIPEPLDTPAFRAAWFDRWIPYCRQRQPRVSQISLTEQLTLLARWGPADAIEAIDHSIVSAWAKLVPPSEFKRGNGKPDTSRHNSGSKHAEGRKRGW